MLKLKKSLSNFFLNENKSLKDAIKKLNKSGKRTLIIIDKNFKLVGTVSDGDIRRNLYKDKILNKQIASILNKKPIFYSEDDYYKNKISYNKTRHHIDLIPIINKNQIVEYVFFNRDEENISEYIFETSSSKFAGLIMAGGLGTRLRPYTDVIPKSLLPYKGNSLIMNQLNLLNKSKIKNTYISINYKKELIKFALKSYKKNKINYLEEDKRLGTAGSLSLIPRNEKRNIFVINCDVILKCDINRFMNFHVVEKNDVSIMVAEFEVPISYGQCIFSDSLALTDVIEKPKIKNFYNVGAYIFSNKIIKELDKNSKIDMNIFIKKLISKNKYILKVYKINFSDWEDYGDLKKMKNLIE